MRTRLFGEHAHGLCEAQHRLFVTQSKAQAAAHRRGDLQQRLRQVRPSHTVHWCVFFICRAQLHFVVTCCAQEALPCSAVSFHFHYWHVSPPAFWGTLWITLIQKEKLSVRWLQDTAADSTTGTDVDGAMTMKFSGAKGLCAMSSSFVRSVVFEFTVSIKVEIVLLIKEMGSRLLDWLSVDEASGVSFLWQEI